METFTGSHVLYNTNNLFFYILINPTEVGQFFHCFPPDKRGFELNRLLCAEVLSGNSQSVNKCRGSEGVGCKLRQARTRTQRGS